MIKENKFILQLEYSSYDPLGFSAFSEILCYAFKNQKENIWVRNAADTVAYFSEY